MGFVARSEQSSLVSTLRRVGKPGISAVPDFFEETETIEERHHHVRQHEIDGLGAGPQHTQRLKSYEKEDSIWLEVSSSPQKNGANNATTKWRPSHR